MKRKLILVIVPVVLLGLFYTVFKAEYTFDYRKGAEDTLIRAFRSSGAAVVETNINAYAVSTDIFLGKGEVEELALSVADAMQINLSESERVENYSSDYNQLSIIGKSPDGHSTVIIVHSMDFSGIENGPGGCETNIVVDVTLGRDLESLKAVEEKIRTVIREPMEEVRTTSCIIGSFEENVPADRMEAIVYSVFRSIDAQEVERAIYDGLISISAYTPRIEKYVQVADEIVNLNVAMRYNSFENKTYIWLGSPVISVEY